MNRREAIAEISRIRRGNQELFDRNDFPEEMRGRIAQEEWNKPEFTFGMEYGFILGLMKAFDIGPSELT